MAGGAVKDVLLILGCGYVARRFVALHGARFCAIAGTSRDPAAAPPLPGVHLHAFAGAVPSDELRAAARAATHVLAAIPPDEHGDPGLAALAADLAAAPRLAWIGYLSTTAVYGERRGGWVDEATAPAPTSSRGQRRLAAEEAWLAFGAARGVPVQVFRLAGLYGPGRNALVELARGTARRLHKEGQTFNRIHVDDVAAALAAALARPRAGPVFNLADDEPAPSADVVAYAADLLGMAPPPLVPLAEAALSEMARSFWAENKRVASRITRRALGLRLAFPTYRAGLAALHAAGEGATPGGPSTLSMGHPAEQPSEGSDMVDKENVKGAAKEIQGRAKDAAGGMMNDPKMQSEGKADKAEGKARQAVGHAKDAVRDITGR
jgi:nucleoside-diphosphate-sugar epimerase/uncharacterized protein YjbJ (UPF0337 family)